MAVLPRSPMPRGSKSTTSNHRASSLTVSGRARTPWMVEPSPVFTISGPRLRRGSRAGSQARSISVRVPPGRFQSTGTESLPHLSPSPHSRHRTRPSRPFAAPGGSAHSPPSSRPLGASAGSATPDAAGTAAARTAMTAVRPAAARMTG
ncbi:hypothetical protein ACFMQL_28290 [Nonomuraea fastidiosa]|uniref:hypothetical protein n=1 Tax=Nonomuraea fastidiosa TaxID=46173 RepID=UPI00366EA33E